MDIFMLHPLALCGSLFCFPQTDLTLTPERCMYTLTFIFLGTTNPQTNIKIRKTMRKSSRLTVNVLFLHEEEIRLTGMVTPMAGNECGRHKSRFRFAV